jgi:hypothetical protein
MAIDTRTVLNGSFCKLYHEGEWLANVTKFEASVKINKEEIKRAGTRSTGQKVTSFQGEGSFTAYKTSHKLVKLLSQITDDGSSPLLTELLVEINDPESPDTKTFLRLKNVQFDTIPLLSYEVDKTVEEEFQYTFEDYEFVE